MSLRNNEKPIQLSAVVHHEKTEPNLPLFHRAILEAANNFGDEIALVSLQAFLYRLFCQFFIFN
jgi:hypothetical protein